MDAAVATALAECVVQPQNVGLGGYGGAMLIYLAHERRIVCIDFNSVAPMAAFDGMFEIDETATSWQIENGAAPVKNNLNEYGCLSISVPGNVAGFALALKKYGTLSWAEVSQPAIELAENGFPVYLGLAAAFDKFMQYSDEKSKRAVLPNGRPPVEEEIFKQPDLAKLMKTLAAEGPEAFYSGPIARAIVEQVKSGGGILEVEDLARYSPTEGCMISVNLGDWELYTPGLPAGGLTALQIVKAMHAAGLSKADYDSGRYFHYLIEISKSAWLDRARLLGDPLFTDDPTFHLLSDEYASATASSVSEERAEPTLGAMSTEGHTVHLVTADEERNMVSLTATQGGSFGSCVAIEGLGLIMGHGMLRFDPVTGRPNSVAPGKRMLHNMSPMMLARDGVVEYAFGLPGGRRIVNVAAQMALGFTMLGQSPGEAVAAPRLHTEGREPVTVGASVSETAQEYLKNMGHEIELTEGKIGGPACAVHWNRSDNTLTTASQAGPDRVGVVE